MTVTLATPQLGDRSCVRAIGEASGMTNSDRVAIATTYESENVKQCSRCRGPRQSDGHRWCRACHAANMRARRKIQPLPPSQLEKDRARHLAKHYQKRGVLVPAPCRDCGSANVEKHHPDYSQPCLVVWLCRPCHLALHRQERAESLRQGIAS